MVPRTSMSLNVLSESRAWAQLHIGHGTYHYTNFRMCCAQLNMPQWASTSHSFALFEEQAKLVSVCISVVHEDIYS